MALPRFEVALGAIDGVNRVFALPGGYIPKTTAVFLNGILYRRDWENGWTETDPALGIVTLNEAPLAGDTVQVFFTDTGALATQEEVSTLRGVITEVESMRGRVVNCICDC